MMRLLEMVIHDAVTLVHPDPLPDLDSIKAEEYIEYQRKPTEHSLIIFELLRTRFLSSGLAAVAPVETDRRILK
jgi:hypothetical protein